MTLKASFCSSLDSRGCYFEYLGVLHGLLVIVCFYNGSVKRGKKTMCVFRLSRTLIVVLDFLEKKKKILANKPEGENLYLDLLVLIFF